MNVVCHALCFLLARFPLVYFIARAMASKGMAEEPPFVVSGERVENLEQKARLVIDAASESYLAQVECLFAAQQERRQPYGSRKQ